MDTLYTVDEKETQPIYQDLKITSTTKAVVFPCSPKVVLMAVNNHIFMFSSNNKNFTQWETSLISGISIISCMPYNFPTFQ